MKIEKFLQFTVLLFIFSSCHQPKIGTGKTVVTIQENKFKINGEYTYKGRVWNGYPVEGLLFNSRMVQGIYDDLNPDTRDQWRYHDTQEWDPERNTREFVDNMEKWYQYGLLSFTLNLQGGSPQGYSKDQPWYNSAFEEDGSLRQNYMRRLEKILNKADELSMITILGIFYFGQDERLRDESAVINAVDNLIDWIFEKGYRNILIEINNECNIRYDHDILKPHRIHELILHVRSKTKDGQKLYVGTSYGGGTIPRKNVAESSDFILLHGNGVNDPAKISEMVNATRDTLGVRNIPILFNEDDHFDFDKPVNNFTEAVKSYASWGFFDYRMDGEGFDYGYQSVPVNWSISSPRKQAFFNLLKDITGGIKYE